MGTGLSIAQGVCQNAGAVVWGLMADRGWMKRRMILCFAAGMQALCTLSLAFISTVPPMWPIRMANGFFRAALRPISNGIVADLAATKEQGYYFGLMQGGVNIGTAATMVIVGPIAETSYFLPIFETVRGWRIGYAAVACVAVVASLFSFFFMTDVPSPPMTEEKQQSIRTVISVEIQALLRFLKYNSFVLMICQGVFGSIPWGVIGNVNLYARLCGFSQSDLAWLGIPGLFGLVGGFLGGVVSDVLNKKIGPRSRGLTAVMTVAMGIPLQYMLWYGIAPGSAWNNVYVFVAILILFNLLAGWAQPGCNFPILGQIVTGKDRNKVMCWEMCFENSMAIIIGNTALPVIVEALSGGQIDYDEGVNLEDARTLGTATALIACVAWSICMVVYAGLMWSFPGDLDWSLRREVQQGQVLSTIWSSWQGDLLRSVHGTHEHPCSIVLCGWSCADGRIPALQFSFPRHSFGLLANLAARAGQADAACL